VLGFHLCAVSRYDLAGGKPDAIAALTAAQITLAKKKRDVQLCGELEIELLGHQEKLTEEGDLTNPKDVRALADCNAQLMMLPRKTVKTIELCVSEAGKFTEMLDKAHYSLKAAAEKEAAAVKSQVRAALKPFSCYVPTNDEAAKIAESIGAVCWITAQANFTNRVPSNFDQDKLMEYLGALEVVCREIKAKLEACEKGFLAAFPKACE
jgi:hypothetical protein